MKLSARSIIVTVAAVLGISGLVLIVGCAPSTSPLTDAQQGLNAAQARATNAALVDQDMRNATEQANARATDTAGRATDTARGATEQAAQATQAAVSATEQAQHIAANATAQAAAAAVNVLTLDQARVAATATRTALDRQMQVDAQTAQRTAAEAQATITAAQVAASTVAQSSAMRSDWYYVLPDVLMRYAPCGVVLLAMLLAWFLVRAIASRIAGDEGRAKIALANPGFTVYLPTALLPAPRYDDEENETETGNTATLGNSGNTGETVQDEVFPVNSSAGTHPVLVQTREEYQELMTVRHEAIGLLNRCLNYYAESNTVDDGTIPRYDKLKMKAEDRGQIVDNLWYSTYVVKTKNRTYTDPQYFGTCAALMQAIISNRAKVLPLNYAERRQERLNQAISQLPQNVRVTA